MVALKPMISASVRDGRKRSRNAVVALKPVAEIVDRRRRAAKQERRGGTETFGRMDEDPNVFARSRNAVVALKLRVTFIPIPARPRSRNAVVALKRHHKNLICSGLERSRNAMVALKSSFDGLRAPGNAPPQSGNVVVAWRMSNPGKA